MPATTYGVTCLSPVHVGTGTQLTKFDGVYEDRQWHRVDLDSVLARGVDANELAQAMSARDFAWVTWLRRQGVSPGAVTAQPPLACPQDPEETPIREAVRDVYGHPYLPGTSVKGAIRTAVLWHLMQSQTQHTKLAVRYLGLCLCAEDLFDEIRRRRAFDRADEHLAAIGEILDVPADVAVACQRTLYDVLGVRQERLDNPREWRNFQQRLGRLGRSREWLGQPVERAALGRDPNHDLLRAVHVSDSGALGPGDLEVGLVWTYTLRGGRLVEKREGDAEYKAFVEWLPKDSVLALQVGTDDHLLSEPVAKSLGFVEPQVAALRDLAGTCNSYARSAVAAERAHYAEYRLPCLDELHDELEEFLADPPVGWFLLNVGWGGGWEIKTVGDLIRQSLGDEDFDALRERYRLGQNPKTRQFDWSAPFPKTRRVAYSGGAPKWPLGWVLLRPKEATG
jgi:CRISPR-associated protein Csm5